MQRIYLFFIFICAGATAPAQSFDSKWLMGYSNGPTGADTFGNYTLSFNEQNQETTVSKTFDCNMGSRVSMACIYNKEKNYMIYSNGCQVLNQHYEYIEGGSSINYDIGNKTWPIYCQDPNYWWEYYPVNDCVFILPNVAVEDKYWVCVANYNANGFNVDTNFTNKYYVGVVDMKYNDYSGRLIDSIWVKTPVKYMPHQSAVCVHDNGLDWWVCLPALKKSGFATFRISDGGVKDISYQDIGEIHDTLFLYGQMVFSPDGKKMAYLLDNDGIQLYDFNDQTGQLSNYQHLDIPKLNPKWTNEGLGFSPNSKFLYAGNRALYQYDTDTTDVQASMEFIARVDTVFIPKSPYKTFIGHMQLAINNKLYVSSGTPGRNIGVINKPDIKGKACDFDPKYIETKGPNMRTLPNVSQFRNKKLKVATHEPVHKATELNLHYDNEATTLYWQTTEKDFINLSIHNVNGIALHKYKLSTDQQGIGFKESLIPGIYIAVFEDKNHHIYTGKFVVSR